MVAHLRDVYNFSISLTKKDKGLLRFKEVFLFHGKCGFMAEGDFFGKGDNFTFGDTEWPGIHVEPCKELLASDISVWLLVAEQAEEVRG